MTEHDEILNRASEILEEYGVGEHVTKLVEDRHEFESNQSIEFLTDIEELAADKAIDRGVALKHQGHQIILGFSKDPESAATGNYIFTYGDAYVYLDDELVLRTDADNEAGPSGYYFNRVSTHPFSLKTFKAGPWMELLKKCHDELLRDSEKRRESERQAQVAEQTSKIDLGDYAPAKTNAIQVENGDVKEALTKPLHTATRLARVYFLGGGALLLVLAIYLPPGRVGELAAYFMIIGMGVAALGYLYSRPKSSWFVTAGLIVAWIYTILILVALFSV